MDRAATNDMAVVPIESTPAIWSNGIVSGVSLGHDRAHDDDVRLACKDQLRDRHGQKAECRLEPFPHLVTRRGPMRRQHPCDEAPLEQQHDDDRAHVEQQHCGCRQRARVQGGEDQDPEPKQDGTQDHCRELRRGHQPESLEQRAA